ncbi:MAG: DUF4838 domain-containing protein [Lentisphaeria bacterium]|nr:DUF4838 domain-containing protein [Lentisphaeria bacterium]
MKKHLGHGAIFLLFLILALPVSAAEYYLMKDGKAASCIVLKSNDPAAKHAAEELALYLGKIGNGKGPAIGRAAVKGFYPVTLELVKDKDIAEEGYALTVNKNGLTLQAKEPVGLIFGAYDILKKYGNIRWLIPGKDGEFYKVMPLIKVKDMARKVFNPSFPVRRIHFHSANVDSPFFETRDWMLRNNLRLEGGRDLTSLKKHGIKEFLDKRAVVIQEGWHCFTRLHNGEKTAKDRKKWAADYKKMFEEHPERFPLIAGKRRFLKGQLYQPCTSNKDNIKIIADNLVKHIRQSEMDKKGGRYIFVNNDNTVWCECANCKAQADPEETKVGHISTHYWLFTNAVVAEARKIMGNDNIPLVGYGYQNFQSVPLGVTPDPKLDVMLSYNRICYRHKLDDPDCPINKTYFQYFKDWTKKSKNVTTWEEISESGNWFHPVEKSYANHLKVYHSIGMKGTTPSMPPPDGIYSAHRKKRMTPQCWRAMWQTMYVAAVLQWDITKDPEKVLEEANSLFFGKAWEGGMKDFRKLLITAASTTPGCFGHGHRAPIGRCLSAPGVHQKLKEYLAKAEKAAASDPDKRILKNVLKDKEFFRNLWEKERERYLKDFRELKAYPKTSAIKIDGNIDEKDWKNADVVSSFKVNTITMAAQQTFVRMVYEPDNLYIAMEMMEPTPSKMISTYKSGRPIWEDNTAEIFINHPDMNRGYIQFIINHLNDVFDAKGVAGSPLNSKFDAEAEIKTKVLKDRWVLEMRIPASSLGLKCFPGHTWLVNFQRYRVVQGENNESSSIASGAGNNVDAFLPVSFAAKRAVAGGMKTEIDSRYWKNGRFSETYKKKPYKNPKVKIVVKDWIFPYAWHDAGTTGYYAIEKHPDRHNDNYMHLKRARFYQLHKGKQSKFRFVLDAKGKGSLWVSVYRYTRTPRGDSGKHLASEYPLKVNLTDKWTTYKVDYQKKDANEVLAIGVHANNEACIDNYFVLPMDEEKK